jgi:hypothetical protein
MTQACGHRKVRFRFDHEGRVATYEITISGPISDAALPPVELHKRLTADGIRLPDIAAAVRNWASDQPDVRKVALSSTGRSYTLTAIIAQLTETRMAEVHHDLLVVAAMFQPHSALIYVLGQDRPGSPLLNAADARVLYPSAPRCLMS